MARKSFFPQAAVRCPHAIGNAGRRRASRKSIDNLKLSWQWSFGVRLQAEAAFTAAVSAANGTIEAERSHNRAASNICVHVYFLHRAP
jgi:hypothetical protein